MPFLFYFFECHQAAASRRRTVGAKARDGDDACRMLEMAVDLRRARCARAADACLFTATRDTTASSAVTLVQLQASILKTTSATDSQIVINANFFS